MLHKISIATIVFMVILLLSGCQVKSNENAKESTYHLYYIDKEETMVVEEGFEPEGSTTEELLDEFVNALDIDSENVNNKKAKPETVKISSYHIDEKLLYLNFNSKYLEMSKIREILLRAALTRFFTQIPGIEYVSIYINDQPLIDTNGDLVGILTPDNFTNNSGEDINFYQKGKFTLYFADKTGKKLVEENVEIFYNSNLSKEKLVIDQLIKGPITDDIFATLSSNTKLISVSTKDNTCYVNFNEGFEERIGEVSGTIAIYSVVNSLTELSGINKVQISINGEIDRVYRENIDLETVFERDLNLLETKMK